MKPQSASLTLYTMDAGHHREACIWHDQDHKAEALATVPDLFISQRWVTPREWLSLLPPSSHRRVGEYVNLYWSAADPATFAEQFRDLGQRMAAVGRMDMLKYMHKTWPDPAAVTMRPTSVQSRPGLALIPEGVLASTFTTGLVTTILESTSGTRDPDFDRWLEADHIPAVLSSGLFEGAVTLVSDVPGMEATTAVLWYTEDSDPAAVYREYRGLAPSAGGSPEQLAKVDTVFESIACPSIGHYDYYD